MSIFFSPWGLLGGPTRSLSMVILIEPAASSFQSRFKIKCEQSPKDLYRYGVILQMWQTSLRTVECQLQRYILNKGDIGVILAGFITWIHRIMLKNEHCSFRFQYLIDIKGFILIFKIEFSPAKACHRQRSKEGVRKWGREGYDKRIGWL